MLHSVLPPGHVKFTPNQDTPRYTLLAHSPMGVTALIQHHDQPDDVFQYRFGGIIVECERIDQPEDMLVPDDYVTLSKDFGTLSAVDDYLRTVSG